MRLSDLARELDTYGAAVRHRDQEGDTAADNMIAEFTGRVLETLGKTGVSPDDVNIVTRNSFFVVMKRKTSK